MIRFKCREITHTLCYFLNTSVGRKASLPILGISILSILPAISYGCTEPTHAVPEESVRTAVRLMNSNKSTTIEGGVADILIFNDDRMQRLDAYQREKTSACSTVKASCTSGHKIFSIVLNSQRDKYDWADINSRECLTSITSSLENEERQKLLMSGECFSTAGMPVNIAMKRLSAEIVLRSLSCDFKGKAYEGQKLSDIKVYLTNVNTEAGIFAESPVIPTRLVNTGRLEPNDLATFKEPEMIMQEIPDPVGVEKVRPDIRLICYPNEAEVEVPGCPFTRLVIEGNLCGHTYYWPLDINRSSGGKGISRNCRYIFDITITRTGQTDPDIPVKLEDSSIKTEIQPWEEKEEYGVRY